MKILVDSCCDLSSELRARTQAAVAPLTITIDGEDYVDDGTIAAVLIDDEATLKRVYHLADGRVELRAANARYAPIILGGENETRNLRILGKAVAFQSNVI